MNESLGHYRIVSKLGAGGMGEVYVAEDTKLKRRVALKVLPPSLVDDVNSRERLQREAEAVAALDHPNIVAVHSLEEAQIDGDPSTSVHFFTMQWIDGKTLGEIIPEEGFDRDTLLTLALPLADAVAAAHRGNIV
ncbi:protein kinase, partial [bacterium]|nr:protein kinase [bacterium]